MVTAETTAAGTSGETARPPWIPVGPTRQELALGAAGGFAGRVADLVAGPMVRKQFDFFQPPLPKGLGTPGDPGLFGPDSVMWRMLADASVVVGGVAAISMQGLHPRAFAGFADHTDFNADPNGRLIRTGRYLMQITYGSVDEARRAFSYAHRMHDHVKGTMPDGRTYDAHEPELKRWVHITIYAGIAAAHRRFGAHPLSDADLDRFIAESGIVGDEFGVEDPPRSWAEMNDAFESYRKLLSINVRAAKGINYFRDPFGLPASLRRVFKAVWPGAVLSMPPFCRNLMMQSEPSTAELAACRALVRSLDAVIGEPDALVRARKRIAAGNT